MIAIIETTVNIPTNLLHFADNFTRWGHKDVLFLIIGDVKSPKEIREIETILKSRGFQAAYWDIDTQRRLGGPIVKRTPLNSGRRRNIGTLLALRDGAEWAIYLDDDNYPTEEDFITEHTIGHRPFISAPEHWFNTGEICDTRVLLFLRGFPLSRRFRHYKTVSNKIITDGDAVPTKIVANQGLCLETPDVDAMTHLTLREDDTRSRRLFASWGIWRGTFIPMNSQNTAIAGRALSCYYQPELGRNGDIIAGYLLQKVAHSMGDAVSVGKPCTRHIRNPHSFISDMESETPSFRLIEDMLPILEGEDIKASSYLDCYVSLVKKLSLPKEVKRDMLAWSEDIA
jgi:hypothetical protein